MMKKNTESACAVVIPEIDLRRSEIHLVGDTPLICHAWAEKAKKEILDKQQKKAKTKSHDVRDPFSEFINSLYWLEGKPEEETVEGFNRAIESGARFGFPAVGFKAAAVSAGYRSGVLPNQVTAKGAFHIDCEMIEINGTPSMREDMVRLGGIARVADLRYRGEFTEWSSVIPIRYNAAVYSLEQIVTFFNLGGFACGVGEWRIEKGGTFGSFHVE